MRAIVVAEAGGPEVLQLAEVPVPPLGPGDLRVQTLATGVNFIELYQRSGVYPMPLPFIPGSEGVGVVVEVGAEAPGFLVGDRVATVAATGSYAEQFVVPAAQAAHVPVGLDFETAAALPLQGCTAHYLANSAARPGPGDTVLVHAGAGGVGLLLTQLLAARGVRVLTTASTEAKRELSLAAGAEASFGYEGCANRVRQLTGGAGAQVVYDGVGRDTFDASLAALCVRGSLVLFGGSSGQVPPFDLQRLNAGGSLSITRPTLVHYMRTSEEREWRYREVFEAALAGTLQVRIAERFPLAQAAAAHRALAGRGTAGKVLLTP